MRRLSAFFLFLALALSLGLGSAAHATEGLGCLEESAAGSIDHSDGDRDEVPADFEKAYPHHHAGCHGHHIGVPVTPNPMVPMSALRLRAVPWDSGRMTLAPSDSALRPPQA